MEIIKHSTDDCENIAYQNFRLQLKEYLQGNCSFKYMY